MGQITLDDMTKQYNQGSILAVDDLSLNIRDGEFLVLVGPSGCGKSTTLRMIAGLESISEGHISIGGTRVNELEPRERDIAMVFQNYALYPHMTVEENIGFGLKLSTNMSESDITERVSDAADMMGIDDLLGQKPKQLSGGQQQRVALGRAIVREPEAFLFDEPLSNLDAKLRSHMRTELTRLQHELNVTSLYVTHDQAEAMTMGDRIAIMNNGILQQVGPPETIYDHPTNQFVAEFIGEPSMNTVSGLKYKTNSGTGQVASTVGTSELNYPIKSIAAERLPVQNNDNLTIGVRPENITISTDDADLDNTEFRTTVDVIETLGNDLHVYFEFRGQVWTARTGRVDLIEGETVAVGFDENALHLFFDDGTTLKSRGTGGDAYHDSIESARVSQSTGD